MIVNNQRGRIIGIDLGTTNSAAAVLKDGKPVIIPAEEGLSVAGKAFPSVVAITEDGQLIVGEIARQMKFSNFGRTIEAAKRKIGSIFKFSIAGTDYTPQEISAFILRKIRKDAEAFLGEKIERAVITVPAYFDNNQRQATQDAAEIAGLSVEKIINEPTAAALAYALDKAQKHFNLMVIDLGGGTLDVTIMEKREKEFQIKSTSGDNKLGGIEMDNALTEYIIQEFKNETGINIRSDKKARERIRQSAEIAKIQLSNLITTGVNVMSIAKNKEGNPIDLDLQITRAQLEELVLPIIERCRSPLMKALKGAKLSPQEIDKVILVGGPTRMPALKKFVTTVMGKEPEGGLDPMEAVAMGAAIQGGIIDNEIRDVTVQDILSLPLGIEVVDGSVDHIIDQFTPIPAKQNKVFMNPVDNTTPIKIHIVQGEGNMAYDCTSLGEFNLPDVPPAKKDEPQIEVTFDIDANGILNVTAKDINTLREANVTINSGVGLTRGEINKGREKIKKLDELDKWKKEEDKIKNEADGLISLSEKMIKEDLRDKTRTEVVISIKKAIDDLKKATRHKWTETIETAISKITRRDAVRNNNVRDDDIGEKIEVIKKRIDDIGMKMDFLRHLLSGDMNPILLKKYYEKSHAVIIGISKYKEEVPLSNAYNDAKAVEKVLKEKYGFNILLPLYNENANTYNMNKLFNDQLQSDFIIGPKDRVIVYYSGHGKRRIKYTSDGREIKEAFVVPYDSKKEEFANNISMETIVKSIIDCPAKHKLLILDCCYSGFAAVRASEPERDSKPTQLYLKEITSKSAIQIIAAGQEDQAVADSGIRPGLSVFTGGLLDILEMDRDLDNDGILTASEIGYNLEKQITRHQNPVYQRPIYTHISGSQGGDFVFKLFNMNMDGAVTI
jgi:molecular chaperone DnaK